jgi:D-alanyl-D-alanine dipeptidase
MFGDLNKLRSRPLPSLDSIRASQQRYRDLLIDQSAPQHREKLTRAIDYGVDGRNYYAHARNPPYYQAAPGAIDALLVRESVGAKLNMVNARLKPEGLKLFLLDAWRPRAVQAYFHDVWVPRELRRHEPLLSEAELAAAVSRYWAAPSEGPLRPAPHATGGAVDITLAWEDGAPLWMGSLFDDATPLAHTDRFENDAGEMSFSNEEARANRRMLYWLMIEAGFTNHPDEWWHYSYGDQMWAKLSGKGTAFYGAALPAPELLAP